jgi:hypothetical protein
MQQHLRKRQIALLVILGGAILLLAIGAALSRNRSQINASKGAVGLGSDELGLLAKSSPADIQPFGELASMFNLGSDYTDVQRENRLNDLKGKVVQWTLRVYEIGKDGDAYKVQTDTEGAVGTIVYLTPRSPHDRAVVEALKKGDMIAFKGTIDDSLRRQLVIKPAILWDSEQERGQTASTPGEGAFVDWDALGKLLPVGYQILEQVSIPVQKPRIVLLWMLNPETRTSDGYGSCDELMLFGGSQGKSLVGRTRISLVDTSTLRLVNTLELHSAWGDEDSFEIPILASRDGIYHNVTETDKSGLGRPTILNLSDYTGEGIRAQFPLFQYAACGDSGGTIVGYSQTHDQVIQYPIVTHVAGGKEAERLWTSNVFSRPPVQPGHWRFAWSPGHGVDGEVHVDVEFDRAMQRYVEKDDDRTTRDSESQEKQ